MDAVPNEAINDVLIVIDAKKLPQMWADAVDVAKPVPLGVTFFERTIVLGDFVSTIVASVVCALLGVICLPLGIYMLWDDRSNRYSNSGSSADWWVIGFGFTTLFASWMCAMSLLSNWKTMRKQNRGEPTRLGVFVSGDDFFEANEHGYTVIPRSRLVSASGGVVKYLKIDPQTKKDTTKSLKLPTALVRDEPRAMAAAVEAWAKA